GSYPFISLRPYGYTWVEVVHGAADAYLVAQAKRIAAWRQPCFLGFHHEPESGLSEFGTPSAFVAAYRHVRRVFRKNGATNCSWVWIVMGWTFDSRSGRKPRAYYPGDAYVDWIAADAYNWRFVRPGAVWKPFARVFAPFRRWTLRHRGIPAMVAETGVVENPNHPGAKAAWYRGARRTLRRWRNFKAFVYFNSDHGAEAKGDDAGKRTAPWWFDSSPQSLAAFVSFAHGRYFQAGHCRLRRRCLRAGTR
ncbi:MAG: hypothetical protein M3295_10010, partial [Chloroflexota bacterium]|nr:hypothetical protein [Chloroflexota bacterium]